jgi:SEC-C motif-containing protein
VTRDVDYLLKTWHPTSRPTAIDRLTIPEWRRLDIISTELGGVGDERGIVEFRATYMGLQNIHILHEVSRFVREKGWWLYVDGEIKNDPSPVGMLNKIGRNASCPCGSGRKFKKCCMG